MYTGFYNLLLLVKVLKDMRLLLEKEDIVQPLEAGLKNVPVVVRQMTEQQMMELAILENLQREDLNPIEEAFAYQTLLERLNLTQDELAKRLGKSRPHITNHVRLLSLPEEIKNYISEGKISMGHGRALLALKNKEKLNAVVEKVMKEKLNVRQLEQYIHQLNENVPRETKTKEQQKKDIFIKQRETNLRERLGTTVTIKQTKKKGKIEIEFFSQEDLDRILDLISQDSGL